ncbi:glycosyltransferase [Colwellia sp. MSW7]|uniref:Glycosyltransferase n=1 Tax=Colwellia maritima TaxID=2912588 RepID=A0ABS9WWA4_9GAMM|nr:glycosyltransferase [Colwellia maritima]MCI2282223.1 glycosyltransferase [Colwellia maritima]
MIEGLISIIVPVYNGQRFIEKTLKTLTEQTYKNIEIILVNDGSTDNSKNIINLISQNNQIFRVFHNTNAGVAAARNFGIAQSRGEFLAFCDQDDLWHPTKLYKQIKLFGPKQIGLVYTGVIVELTEQQVTTNHNFNNKLRGYVFHELIFKNMFTCCTVMVRKSFLEQVDGFEEDRGLMGVDDWHLWLKLSLVCEFDYVAEHLATHVFHGDNYSLNELKMYEAELACLSNIKKHVMSYKIEVNWYDVEQQIHLRYAQEFVASGMYKKGGNVYLLASRNNIIIIIKGLLFKFLPYAILSYLQKVKRNFSA